MRLLNRLLMRIGAFLKPLTHRKVQQFTRLFFYSTNQKNSLIMYPLDSRIEFTNNLAERVIKTFVLGRKNWLFSDTDKGNDRNAKCYSIIESAKANNINVFEFLTPILTELSKYENKPTNEQIEQFLPWPKSLSDYCLTKYAKRHGSFRLWRFLSKRVYGVDWSFWNTGLSGGYQTNDYFELFYLYMSIKNRLCLFNSPAPQSRALKK